MGRSSFNKIGLAAVILLAPGGFILGASLAAHHYRKKQRAAEADAEAIGER